MVWIWLSVVIVLLGAQMNAEMEHQTAKDSTEGKPKPLGARGARPGRPCRRSPGLKQRRDNGGQGGAVTRTAPGPARSVGDPRRHQRHIFRALRNGRKHAPGGRAAMEHADPVVEARLLGRTAQNVLVEAFHESLRRGRRAIDGPEFRRGREALRHLAEARAAVHLRDPVGEPRLVRRPVEGRLVHPIRLPGVAVRIERDHLVGKHQPLDMAVALVAERARSAVDRPARSRYGR